MAYIGREPQIGNFQICDAITVVDAQAAYTMQVGGVNVSPESANHMLVSLNGILQAPTSSFTVSGSTITFASNLVTGDVIDFIQILGNVLDLGVPSDNTVTAAKLNNNIISGQTALTDPPTDTDELLISDAGTIKKIDVSFIGGLAKVSSASGTGLSSQASIEIALPETYRAFKMYLDIKPETDDAHLQATLSINDGSSYYTSSNNYQYGYQHIYANNTAHDVIYSNGDTKIELSKDGGNDTANAEGHHLMFDIKPINTESSVNQHNNITWEGSRNDGSNNFRTIRGSGVLAATYTNKINKIKIAYDSGNIEDYFYTLYGYLA
jgi:hypothetical protein